MSAEKFRQVGTVAMCLKFNGGLILSGFGRVVQLYRNQLTKVALFNQKSHWLSPSVVSMKSFPGNQLPSLT